MRAFNLEEAKAGKPLITRDGRDAKFIAYLPEADNGCQVIALVEKEVLLYYVIGKHAVMDEYPKDLFMKTAKKIVYANLWVDRGRSIWGHHETEEKAKHIAGMTLGMKIIAIAVPIEIEE